MWWKMTSEAMISCKNIEITNLYEEIKDFVIRNQKASTSLLQRYFTLGYSRAARMIDRLEAEGIIGEANGAKPREVLMTYNNDNKEDNVDE